MPLPPIRLALPALLLALAACDGGGTETPAPAGGDYTAVLQSPNGAEAAAHLELTGAGIEDVQAAGVAFLASSPVNGGRRVVVVRNQPGTIEFRLRMAEGQGPPAARVVEVASPEDEPRASLAGYRVNFTRVAGQ